MEKADLSPPGLWLATLEQIAMDPVMTVSTVAALVASFTFIAVMLWAAAKDLTTMKISNGTILLLIVIYAFLAPLAGFGMAAIGSSAVIAVVVLISTLILFSFGWIGGGDAKLITAAALWLGNDNTLPFLTYTSIFGGVLTLVILQFRSMPLRASYLEIPWILRLHSQETGVPYAIAIALGALVVFPRTIWVGSLP